MTKQNRPKLPAQLACGIVAGPLFVIGFTAIGARRSGYDWRRHAVSSLAAGDQGWQQRANFVLAGVLYSCAALGLGRCPRRNVGPRVVPALVAAAGIPVAGLASAVVAARRTDDRWACYSAGSSLVMVGSFLLFGASFGRESGLAGNAGVYQRISVASGFGWLTALSLRALSSLRRP
jgi:hypothetical protein